RDADYTPCTWPRSTTHRPSHPPRFKPAAAPSPSHTRTVGTTPGSCQILMRRPTFVARHRLSLVLVFGHCLTLALYPKHPRLVVVEGKPLGEAPGAPATTRRW